MNEMPLVDRFVTAIGAIYVAAYEPSNWPNALQAIADYFDDVGANLIWRRDDGSFGNIVSPRLRVALEDYERGNWWRHDIRAIRSHEYGYRATIGAITDRHYMTPQEIESHPIYRDFLARHGLRWVAGVEVSPDPLITVALSVQRSDVKAEFSDAELGMLTRLGAHTEKSLRLSIRLLDAELGNVGLGAALARLGIGVFALDSVKRVVFMNPAGERMLGDGLALVNERLLVGDAEQRAALEGAIERMIRAEPNEIARETKPILVRRQKSERPFTVYVLPVSVQAVPEAQFLTHTRAIVLVIDPDANEPADPAVVRDVLGLTLGEARVAASIGAGLSPREAAEKLGITEETARTTLKRVFAKVGVSRQSELTALLTKLVLR